MNATWGHQHVKYKSKRGENLVNHIYQNARNTFLGNFDWKENELLIC